jgi:hypothetical protein
MPSQVVRDGMIGLGLLIGSWLGTNLSEAQEPIGCGPRAGARPSPQTGSFLSAGSDPIDQLLRMSPGQLDALYQHAAVGPIPTGQARGNVLFRPGTAMARPLTKASKVVWQGKVFNLDDSTAVNRFFGIRIIRGKLYYGPSWMDGNPSIILDYSTTSLVYAKYRDEFREVAPGLFLGLMYARTSPDPTLKMYFALLVP